MTTHTFDISSVRLRDRAKPQAAVWALIFVCMFSALAGRLCYLQRTFDYDASMFVYLGKSVCDGDRFGHDVIDNKFPTVGMITSVCWRMFGNQWADYVLLQTALSFAAAWMLARCAAKNFGEHAKLPTLLAAMVYLNFTVAVYGGFQLETMQVFFAVIAACAAIEAIESRSLWDAVLVGLASGCAGMLKPTGIGPLIAFGTILAIRPGLKRAGLGASALLGFGIVTCVVLFELVRAGILLDMPQIVQRISTYASQTPMAWQDVFKPMTVLVLLGFAMVVRGIIFRRESHQVKAEVNSAIVLFTIIWFVLELFGAIAQRRFYAYHFLPLAAPAALLFGMLRRKVEPLPLAFALGPMMGLSLWSAAQVQPYPNPPAKILPVSAYLLQHASAGDAVWQDNLPRVLLETNLRPGARFPIMFLLQNSDTSPLEDLPLIQRDFEIRKPKYIVLPADLDRQLDFEVNVTPQLARSTVRAANYKFAWREIEKYTKQKYVLEARIQDQAVYHRRD